MKRGVWLTGAALGGLAVALVMHPPRGALRLVVEACVLAEKYAGTPFPCLDVALGRDGRPGTVTIRAPDSSTHVIVTPIDPIDGIEDTNLLRPEAGHYWRVALSARHLVSEAANPPVPVASVGLAVNSAETRSQDHLHIHAECVRPAVLATLRAGRPPPDGAWHRLGDEIADDHPWVMRIGAADISRGNLFATLASVPEGPHGAAGVKAILVDLSDGQDFVLAGIRSATSSVEDYFNASCGVARKA